MRRRAEKMAWVVTAWKPEVLAAAERDGVELPRPRPAVDRERASRRRARSPPAAGRATHARQPAGRAVQVDELSSSAATCSGSSHIGRWPASRRITRAHVRRRLAQPRDHPVVLGPGERDRDRGSAPRPENVLARIAALTSVKPGRERVGADQVARGARAASAPGARRTSPSRARRSARHARQRAGERQREPRGRAGQRAPRRQRLAATGRRADRHHAARPAGQRELERDPAAERVAGDVRSPRRRARRARPRPPRASAAGVGVGPSQRRRARRSPGRSTAITSRSPASSSITGAQTRAVGAERVQQHERRARARAVERELRRGGGRAHALATARSGSRAGDAGRQCGLANSACASPMRCSAKPASQ